jgi:hypothetical protein
MDRDRLYQIDLNSIKISIDNQDKQQYRMMRKRWFCGVGQSDVLAGLWRKGVGKLNPVAYRGKRGILIGSEGG